MAQVNVSVENFWNYSKWMAWQAWNASYNNDTNFTAVQIPNCNGAENSTVDCVIENVTYTLGGE